MTSSSSLSTISPDDVLKLRFVQSADLSPDGSRVVYAVSWADAEGQGDRAALFLLDVERGLWRQLTAGTARDLSPVWSPDGSEIAFVSDRAGQQQLFVISPDGGEARQVTRLPLGVSGAPDWSPDGTRLAFSALAASERRDPTRPYRVTRTYYRLDEVGYVEDSLLDVHVVEASGGEPTRLTHDAFMNTLPRWTADGRAVAYLAGCDPDAHLFANRVRVVDLQGRVQEVQHPPGLTQALGLGPDGRLVFVQSFALDRPMGSRGDLYVADLAAGRAVRRTSGPEPGLAGRLQPDSAAALEFTAVGITPLGEALAPVQVGGRVGVHAFSLDGPERAREVVGGDRNVTPLRLRGSRLLFAASSSSEPGDLYLADLEGGERRLTWLNGELLGERALPTVEHLGFAGAGGTPVEGWFLRPPAGEPPYPTVLYIHGGPHGGFGHAWHSDMQLLCGAGFGVLIVNHRGSTGYGDEFASSLVGRWGELDYGDLMAGVDHAIERGLADAGRLGVCGLSGGGNLTCWIVGQTDRFKAAVPENPVTNFLSFYGVADIGPWFMAAETGGPPWERLEQYLRQSPITYAHRCRTPTLLVQGEADLRCPAEQSEQFYAVLRANGCVAEMLRLPGASHTGAVRGPVPVRRAQNEALLDWMTRYVLGAGPQPSGQTAVTAASTAATGSTDRRAP